MRAHARRVAGHVAIVMYAVFLAILAVALALRHEAERAGKDASDPIPTPPMSDGPTGSRPPTRR